MTQSNRVQVFAVVRYDAYLNDFEPQNHITVKEILPTREEAESEAARLNDLRSDDASFYFVQQTRFYPEGRQVQVDY